jgi:hypothetical protein
VRDFVLVWAAVLWILTAGKAMAGAAGATPSVDAAAGSIVRPASGLYVLDRAIGFNVLDAVAINPKTGAITLVGHRDRRYGDVQIPYLDLLATLLEHPRPRFRLMPTPESTRTWQTFFKDGYGNRIIDAFGQLYARGQANADARSLLGLPSSPANQSALTDAVIRTAADEQRARDLAPTQPDLLRAALLAGWMSPDGIQFGPDAMRTAFNLRFGVRPEYIEIDPHSLVASVMLHSDYVAKGLLYDRGLEATVPGYQTEFAFSRSGAPEFNRVAAERAWFSVGHIDLTQSKDRNTLRISSVSMRVNIRAFDDHLVKLQIDSPNEKPSLYEARLSALFDPLSRRLPVLHELAECAKLAAVARWLQSRNPHFDLPKNGRTRWNGPDQVGGHFYAYLSVPRGRGPTTTKLILDVQLAADGGVSLDPFPGESGLPDIHVDPVVLDLNDTGAVTPPTIRGLPPDSKLVGWVRDAPNDSQIVRVDTSRLHTADLSGTLKGPFGESQSVPNLQAANNPPAGGDTNALDQVRAASSAAGAASAAAIAETTGGEASLGFDTSGAGGGMPPVPPTQLGSPSQKIPAAVWNDKLFQKLLGEVKRLDEQGTQIQAQIKQQEQTVANAPPDQKSTEEVKLSELYQRKSDNDSQKNYVNVEARLSFNVNMNVTPDNGANPSSNGAAPSTVPPNAVGP